MYHPHPHRNHHHHSHKWSMTFKLLLAGLGLLVVFFQGVKLLWLFGPPGGYDYEQMDVQVQVQHADESLPTTSTTTSAITHVVDSKRIIKRNVVTRSNPMQAICEEPLRSIFQRQYCLLQASRGDLSQCLSLLEEEEKDKPTNDESLLVLVPGPVHQLSYMAGQGTGRILQQGVRTCLLAAVLHRPCSIDLYRDKHYNLRAFLQPGPYHWDTASHVVMAQNGANISDALHQMPDGLEKGHGWEALVSVDQNQVPEYDNVLPMVWGTGEDNKPKNPQAIPRHLNEWDGRNVEHGHKVLLSPNFGDAWYGYGKDQIRLNTQVQKLFGPSCTGNHLKTFLQNEMFVPTALSYELHLQRRAIVLQEPQLQHLNSPNKKNNQDDSQPKGERLTTRSGLSARDMLPPYGAIHLRTKILNQDMYKFGVSKQQMLEGVLQCFQTLNNDDEEEGETYHGMRWWLISDDVETAHFISQNVSSVYSYASSDELERLFGKNSDTKATTAGEKEKAKAVKGIHSGDALKQLFGQEAMAPNIIDWMGLHESHISLITYDSAYGETGARGNGKIQTKTCGGKIQGKNIPMFYIYK